MASPVTLERVTNMADTTTEYSLMYSSGCNVSLLERLVNENGKAPGSTNRPAYWNVIAHFNSYLDAEKILRQLTTP